MPGFQKITHSKLQNCVAGGTHCPIYAPPVTADRIFKCQCHASVSTMYAKSLLLTYSQTTEEQQDGFLHRKENHFEHVTNALGSPRLYRLGRELRHDDGTHFHVFVAWDKRISIQKECLLDFYGSHPNIKAIQRFPEYAWDYVGKDGDVIHELGGRPRKSVTLSSRCDSVMADALHEQCKEKFLSTLRNRAPRDYVLYHDAITSFANKHYSPSPRDNESPPIGTALPQPIIDWYNQSRIREGDRNGPVKSLAIWGPSHTGKTLWARSLGKHAWGPYPPNPTHNATHTLAVGQSQGCWPARYTCRRRQG